MVVQVDQALQNAPNWVRVMQCLQNIKVLDI